MLVDDRECPVRRNGQGDAPPTPPPTPVDLELEWVLGKMPRKVCGVGGMGFSCSPLHTTFYPTCTLSPVCPACPRCSHSLSLSVLQEFFLQRKPPVLQPLALPPGLSVRQALERVLRLPAVASKRYLTNKVLPAPLLCPLPASSVHPPLPSHP